MTDQEITNGNDVYCVLAVSKIRVTSILDTEVIIKADFYFRLRVLIKKIIFHTISDI